VFRRGLQGENRNSPRNASNKIPLNDSELQRLANAIRPVAETGDLTDQSIWEVRSVVTDYFSRTGVKLSKAQYQESFGPSVVTSKPANGGQVKTGQQIKPETRLFYLFAS
jgi:hypothetical protein